MVPHKPDVVYDTRDRGDNLRAGEARRFAVAMGQTAQVRFSIIRPGQSANVEWLTYAPTEDELDLENTSVLSWGRVDPGETDLRPQIAMDVSCPDGHLWVASTVNTHLVITTLATAATTGAVMSVAGSLAGLEWGQLVGGTAAIAVLVIVVRREQALADQADRAQKRADEAVAKAHENEVRLLEARIDRLMEDNQRLGGRRHDEQRRADDGADPERAVGS
eukprot:g14897.t1